METNNTLSKEYLTNKYEHAPYGIIILSPNGEEVLYANFAATVSLGCLLDGTNITSYLCAEWKDMVDQARRKRQTTFIPFKEQAVFTYLRITPIIRNDKTVAFLGNTVSAVEAPGISLTPIEFIDDENHFGELLSTLETAMSESKDKETSKILKRMYGNALKLYNHRRDYVDFIMQNYFYQKDDKTVFTLLSIILVVSKSAFRIELNKTAMMKADTLYIRGGFDLYRVMLEEVVYFMLTQTGDPSPITAGVDFYNGRITLTLFKRGTKAKGKSRMRRKNDTSNSYPPPLIQLMEATLASSNVTVDFDVSEDAIIAVISMDYVMGNPKPKYEQDSVRPLKEDVSEPTDIFDYNEEEYEDYYIDY